MGAINKQPVGWLGFLGIKNFGRNPEQAATVLAPTWDIASLYLGSNTRYARVTANAIGIGGLLIHSPPDGEAWVVLNYSSFVQAAAASSVVTNLAMFGQGPASNATVMLGDAVTLGASTVTQTVARLYQPLYVGPGESLGVSTSDLTGTVNLVTGLRYVVLPV